MIQEHRFELKLLNLSCAPVQATPGSAAFDLVSAAEEKIYPGQVKLIPVGFKMALSPNHCALILPRSGMALKRFLRPANTPGLVDSDYRGEVMVALENFGEIPQFIYEGDRIAQMLIIQLPYTIGVEALELSETSRGKGGFGSTGENFND